MALIVLMIAAAVLLAPLGFFVWMHTASLQAGQADALIVLGYRCDNDQIHPLLKERLDSALDLAAQYDFKKIIVSGGAVASNLPEAEIMKRYLVLHGIPADKILLEDRSRNTVHNVINSRILMKEHGLESCLVVSNSFHIRRMQYIMKQLGIPPATYADRKWSSIIIKQWKLTFQEIRAYRLTLPWLDKAKQSDSLQMMG